MNLFIVAFNNQRIDRILRAHLTEKSIRRSVLRNTVIKLVTDQYSWKWSTSNTIKNATFDDVILIERDLNLYKKTSEPDFSLMDDLKFDGILIRGGYVPLGKCSIGYWNNSSPVLIDEQGIIIGVKMEDLTMQDEIILQEKQKINEIMINASNETPLLTKIYPHVPNDPMTLAIYQNDNWFTIYDDIILRRMSHFIIDDSVQVINYDTRPISKK